MNLFDAAKRKFELQAELSDLISQAKTKESSLRKDIESCNFILNNSTAGIDQEKVDLAKTILRVRGSYDKGGDDRASVINDVIKQLSTGVPIREIYGDLWRVEFGTKNYDRWSGQRSDHEYGYGPKHGGIVFSVGLTDNVRKSKSHGELTQEEIESAIYYLLNISKIQANEKLAKEQSAA